MAFNTSEFASATNKIYPFRCYTIADGKPNATLAFNSTGITAKYTISGSTPVAITIVTATQGTYASGGLVVVNAAAGAYEIHAPVAVQATAGRTQIDIWDASATPIYVCEPIYLDILGVDPRSAAAMSADVTKWNGTAVTAPNTAGTPVVDMVRMDGTATSALVEVTAAPASTASLLTAFRWMFAKSLNKITQTATTQLVRNNADAATIATSTVSDDGTTAIRGKFV